MDIQSRQLDPGSPLQLRDVDGWPEFDDDDLQTFIYKKKQKYEEEKQKLITLRQEDQAFMERFIQALESNRIGDLRAVETIFVTDYQDDYLYLKYLKFALIDVKSLVGETIGTKIADFLDDNFSEFIDEHIEYMDPKPTDDLRTFTKENFKKVINLLNGTEKSNRLALRTIIGKHSRDEMAGTPRAEPAAESKEMIFHHSNNYLHLL